jgi:RNA polymerase sigma-70 factor, ECF subfamily
MVDRSNEQWLADLRGSSDVQADALTDLRQRLQRGIYYYLSRERSDLASLSSQEVNQMAEDLAQDATLRVLENLESFRGDSRFTTWATKIAVRVAISDLRRARYKDFSLEDITADGELMPDVKGVGGSTPVVPESQTEREDVLLKVDHALREALTERQRQALIAVAVQDIPMDIVAERMGTNRNALYKLVHDARRKLRTYLEQQGLSTSYMINLFQE